MKGILLILALAVLLLLLPGKAEAQATCGHVSTWDHDGDADVDIMDILAAFRGPDAIGTFGSVEGDADYSPAVDYLYDGRINIMDVISYRGRYGQPSKPEVRIADAVNIVGFEVAVPYTGSPPTVDFTGTIIGEGSDTVTLTHDDGTRLLVGAVDFGPSAESGDGLLFSLSGIGDVVPSEWTWVDDGGVPMPLVECW